MFNDTKTLIVVYKDEMLMNQLKKLVEAKDEAKDDADGVAVGTIDGSIKIVAWTEKVWNGQKKAGNIDSKVLFLGDIKGMDNLIPVLDIKFDKFGVKYGWAGNQAVLFIDPKVLKKKEDYLAFIVKLNEHPVPEMIKGAIVNIEVLDSDDVGEDTENLDEEETVEVVAVEPKKQNFFAKAGGFIKQGAETAGKTFAKIGTEMSDKAKDAKERSKVKRQMYFYGVMKLYENGLDEFMRS